jgi:hypothetical protein
MSDTQHCRFRSEQAKRLARQVTDTTILEKPLENADRFLGSRQILWRRRGGNVTLLSPCRQNSP